MKELIETLVKALVDHPEEVNIQLRETDRSMTYELSVHPDDVGKIIGRNGRIAKAIRTVVYASATREKKKVYVDIL